MERAVNSIVLTVVCNRICLIFCRFRVAHIAFETRGGLLARQEQEEGYVVISRVNVSGVPTDAMAPFSLKSFPETIVGRYIHDIAFNYVL